MNKTCTLNKHQIRPANGERRMFGMGRMVRKKRMRSGNRRERVCMAAAIQMLVMYVVLA